MKKTSWMHDTSTVQQKIFVSEKFRQKRPSGSSSGIYFRQTSGCSFCLRSFGSLAYSHSWLFPRVHKNKSRQLHTMGSVTAEFEVRHRWRTTTLFSGRYALNAEHVHARSLQKLDLFDWHFRLGLRFACTCSSKYSVQRWVQRSRINVFPFLVQTDVGSDDELRILPWQHS